MLLRAERVWAEMGRKGTRGEKGEDVQMQWGRSIYFHGIVKITFKSLLKQFLEQNC